MTVQLTDLIAEVDGQLLAYLVLVLDLAAWLVETHFLPVLPHPLSMYITAGSFLGHELALPMPFQYLLDTPLVHLDQYSYNNIADYI